MIEKDLLVLGGAQVDYALEGLARGGVTLADCRRFFAKHRTEEEARYVKHASDCCRLIDGLQIDADAEVSIGGEPGAYVAVWLWVEKPE